MAFTIPSLALFVTIPSIVGLQILDPLNVVIALTIYSTALLVRAVPEALDSVPADGHRLGRPRWASRRCAAR